ncbi:MAG: rRNA maturation RNase YbeY [Patescibacteria group bacterium]
MIRLALQQSLLPSREQFSNEFAHVFAQEINRAIPTSPNGIITIAFVSDDEIHRINRLHRQIDKPTDVLSFSYEDDPYREDTLGDIIISYAQATQQATGDVRHELLDLMVHGVLHILHYDHMTPPDAEQMFPLQDQLVSTLVPHL